MQYQIIIMWLLVALKLQLFLLTHVLWRCWLGGRKGIRPVKNWVVGYWHGYLSGARCRLAYGPADATATHCVCVGCHYFPPGLQLPPQPLRGLLQIFCCLVNRGTMGVNSLPKTVTLQRRDCDLNPGPSAHESSTLTTRLPSHQPFT